jgi:hypothetical protein
MLKLHRGIFTGAALVTLAVTAIPQTHAASFPSDRSVKIAKAVVCSPIKGTWFYNGTGIPVSQSGNRLRVNMSALRRPNATGRILSETQIEVTFPDDATFIGTLDGAGKINWNNDTVWQATRFTGTWRYEGNIGPKISQVGDQLRVNMSHYGRPMAQGTITTITSPSVASVVFPDDATHIATLVSPSCIKWSNGTIWTK